MRRFTRAWIRYWRPTLALATVALLGAAARGFFPPFVLDSPFWRTFWLGPPAAGVFALAGALVAYLAARVAAGAARQNARRTEWWARAEWALDLARSGDEGDRYLGGRALTALAREATAVELEMIHDVWKSATAPRTVDTNPNGAEDGTDGGGHGGGFQKPEA